MHLNSQYYTSSAPSKPVLVFLHGLLGCGDDWQTVVEQLPEFNRLLIDLPGHGNSTDITASSSHNCCKLIEQTIKQALQQQNNLDAPLLIVGYSMGARLAMVSLANHVLSSLNIVGYILEGGHFGLTDSNEKQQRLKHDTEWANRFSKQPIEQVLSSWYRQTVFSSLNDAQRQVLIEKRRHNRGEYIADMLTATSLAKQDYLLPKLTQYSNKLHYVCGENDSKFFQLADSSGLNYSVIKGAGHNSHKEQPKAFAQLVRSQVAIFLK